MPADERHALVLLGVLLVPLLQGCQDVTVREVTVITYVVGNGCQAVRSLDDGTSARAEVSPGGSGQGLDVAGAGIAQIARLLASRVGCEP